MYESIFVVILAVILDLTFGDPRNKYHPTAWIGRLIAWGTRMLKPLSNPKLNGVILCCLVASIPITLLISFQYLTELHLSSFYFSLVSIILGAILLKTTIAIHGLYTHAMKIFYHMNNDDLESSRTSLAMIVKRDTGKLNSKHVLSGVLESISENTVDGVTAPLFYFGLFGLAGAFTYRCINTFDSMIGYKTVMFEKFGWFAAKSDSVLNYLPSRLTSIMMILSCMLLGYDWRSAYHTTLQDANKTESINAGYPMATLAGALGVQLEKLDQYTLGTCVNTISIHHIKSSIRIMILSSVLFCIMITIPLVSFLSYLGWWFIV